MIPDLDYLHAILAPFTVGSVFLVAYYIEECLRDRTALPSPRISVLCLLAMVTIAAVVVPLSLRKNAFVDVYQLFWFGYVVFNAIGALLAIRLARKSRSKHDWMWAPVGFCLAWLALISLAKYFS